MPDIWDLAVSALRPRSNFERRLLVFLAAAAAVLAALAVFTSPLKALAVLLTVAAIALSIARPYLVVLALAVWTPLEPFLLKFVPDELYVYARYFPEALIYLMAALVVAHVLIERRRLPSAPLDLPFMLFLASAAVSLVLNLVPLSTAVFGLRQIIRYIIFFYAVYYLAPPKTRIRQSVLIIMGIAAFESALGIIQALAGGLLDPFLLPSERRYFESIQLTAGVQQFWAPGQRVFATMGRYDQLGTFLCFFGLIGAGLLYEAKQYLERKHVALLMILLIPALALTYSRASWFGFIGGLLLIGIVLKRDRRVAAALGIFLAIVAGIFAYEGVIVRYLTDVPQQTITQRFLEAFSPERWTGEYYGHGRMYWLVTTPLVVVPASPFFGFGPGTYGGGAAAALHNTAVYDRLGIPFGVYGTDGQIDTNWMSLWGEVGTIGLIFYAAMLFVMARTAYVLFRRSENGWSRGLALGFLGAEAAVAFQALLGSYLEVRTLALFLWFVGALIAVLAREERLA